MTTTKPNTGTLAGLRALATTSPTSITDLIRTAEHQAELLREVLATTTGPLRARLTQVIPSLCIEVLDAMPVPGVSFWGNGRWHIHLREGDSPSDQCAATLHELKHIIDYPQRERLRVLTTADWEEVATYFAQQVLAREPTAMAT